MTSHRVTETELFKLLKRRETRDGFEGAEVSSRVNAVAAEAWPLLQQVARSFPLYTLHDPEHSFRVAENMARIIPKRTLGALNSIELSVLLYAAYLHDIGMAATQDELYGWLESNSYEAFLSAHDSLASTIRMHERHRGDRIEEQSQATVVDDLVLREVQDVAFTEYLRESHAKRGADYILTRFGSEGTSDNKIRAQEVNYARYVALVCESHFDSATLLKGEAFRRDAHIGAFSLNLQYCAVILRLADLADLDAERTPKVLLDFIMLDLQATNSADGILAEAKATSAKEWAKHRAVLGYKITADDIRIEAICTHPAIQRGLNEWCAHIDRERRDCRLLVQDNRQEITSKYELDLVNEVRTDFIRSDGSYIYADFKFQLDYDRIVSLLMGTELWGDPAVVFRELLQNALDACHHRQALSARLGIAYKPRIRFATEYRREGSRDSASLVCDDNGTGMDQHIVENFLMRIGRSYYHSPEFRQQNLAFQPIGQFGLGVMSYFMIANSLRVDTRRFDGGGQGEDAISVEVNSAGRYVVIRPSKEPREGTAVTLLVDLRDRKHTLGERMRMYDDIHHPMMILDMTADIVRALAIHVDIPIELQGPGGNSIVIEPEPFAISSIDPTAIPGMRDRYREFIFRYDAEDTNGLTGVFRFLIPQDENGQLRLVTLVHSLFKVFIDPDGDLCLAAPEYEDRRVKLEVSLPNTMEDPTSEASDSEEHEQWSDDELRGVYRHKFGRKPLDRDYSSSSELLERVESDFRWSQNGLVVGKPEVMGRMGRRTQQRDQKGDQEEAVIADLFREVPVVGLNAADIDLRGVWQLPLNVQRTDFQRGALLEAFVERYYILAAEMWREILRQADMLSGGTEQNEFIDSVLKRASWELRTQLKKAINYGS